MTTDSVQYEIAWPPAHALIESLRGVGYSLETAVADLVDNAVAAGASSVWLSFMFDGPDSWFTMLDDGSGMDAGALRLAMTVGGRNPLEVRSATDLGRFGMGLKTASFSQARTLTVASRPAGGDISVRRWDLDYIARPDINEWRLLQDPADGSAGRLDPLGDLDSGTLILWEKMDRVMAGLSDDARGRAAFLKMVSRVEQHLSMVFHRYLEGSAPRLRLHIGKTRLRAWDPFLTDRQTAVTPVERIISPGGAVEVQGFILPHRDQLDQDTFERAGGRDGWTSQQGFYVYRNDRMLVSGGWLGLGEPRGWTREEPFRLARLSVNFSNAADSDWAIDIKKSSARPPRAIRARLTELAASVRTNARRVFAHRGVYGPRAASGELTSVWISAAGAKSPAYRVNRSHPAVARLLDVAGSQSAETERLLSLVETHVPVQRIWLDSMEQGDRGQAAPPPTQEQSAAIQEMAAGLLRHLTERVGLTRDVAMARLRTTEPFQNYPSIVDRLGPDAETG